jgi:hypothetical protein
MKLVIDLSSRISVTDIGNNSPTPPYTIKSQDTAVLNVYFVSEGLVQDLGSGTTLKFGLVQSGSTTLLVLDTAFSRQIDAEGNVFYQGFPVFNNATLLGAIGSSLSITCTGEVRYQQPDGEIVHCLDIPFLVYRTILQEVSSTTTTAAFTQPAIGATVSIAVVTTSFLSPVNVVAIGTHNDSYTVTAVTDATHFTASNLGTGTTAPGTTVPSGTTVSLASPNVLASYPDASILELKTNKNIPSGYAGLNGSGSGYISNTHVLVDGVTVTSTDPAGLATIGKLTVLLAGFSQPAVGSTVVATVANSAPLVLNQAVFIQGGGYYLVTALSGTSVTLKNNGDPGNAIAGTTVPFGAALLSAQAVSGAGGGSPGVNAYTTLSAGFTVPAVGGSVSLTVGNTTWIGGNGQILFIGSAGYYSVSSITDATHVVVTNLGYLGNASPGGAIASGVMVTPGGLIGPSGPSGTSGGTAYDKTAANFTMPAASASVSITIGSTAWLAVGQVIFIATAGYLQVSSITNATQFWAVNLNYTGNAPANTTIAGGSAVSPGGVIGPTGSGGAGKDAFTTLTNNFTQPAVNATVSVVVGKTAFMAVGQVLFVQGGGYYTVSSITDAVTVVLSNLGYVGNAAPGATVSASGGNVAVVPGGLAGAAGANAYTATVASFTMPIANATVTVNVAATSFMAQGQILYIPTAGYFSVSVVNDATHVVLTNLGYSGNASSGTSISSGAPVIPAGIQGSAGSGGGGGGTLSDATTSGTSVISNPTGVLKRFAAGSSNLTVTDTGSQIVLDAPGAGGGGGLLSRLASVELFDDFCGAPVSAANPSGCLGWIFQQDSGSGAAVTANTAASTTAPEVGLWSFISQSTGTTVSARLTLGNINSGWTIGPANGATYVEWRLKMAAGQSGTSYAEWRFGLSGYNGGASGQTNNDTYFRYNLNLSANWACIYQNAAQQTADSGVAVSTTAYVRLGISINSAWTQAVFSINGTTVATVTLGAPPAGSGWSPFCGVGLKAGASNYQSLLDWCYIKYSTSRP